MTVKPVAPSHLALPESVRAALVDSRQKRVHEHGIGVDTKWWNAALRERRLSGGPMLGSDPANDRQPRISLTRGAVFELARPVAQGDPTDEEVLRLLWHALAWGSGGRYRQDHTRMDAFRETTGGSENIDLLRRAAAAAQTDPRDAYGLLIRRGGGVIDGLGPSFFTKFLYFAGAGEVGHPCAILDARVATALHRGGWGNLPAGWSNWYTDTYVSYCELLTRWAREEGRRLDRHVGIDEIERGLFDAGA